MDDSARDQIEIGELLGWTEFCCWTALVLAPVIWFLQGPSVSKDQFVVRTALVSVAGVGAIVLRFTALLQRVRGSKQDPKGGFDRNPEHESAAR